MSILVEPQGTKVTFGSGDIVVTTATTQESVNPNEVVIINAPQSGTVGESAPIFDGMSLNDIEFYMVRMHFDSKDSLQVLLDALNKVKDEWDLPRKYIYVGKQRHG